MDEFKFIVTSEAISKLTTIASAKQACSLHYGKAFHYASFHYNGNTLTEESAEHIKIRGLHAKLFAEAKTKLHELKTSTTAISDYMQLKPAPYVGISMSLDDVYNLMTKGINA